MTGHTLAIVMIVVFVPTWIWVAWFGWWMYQEEKKTKALLEQYGYPARSRGQAAEQVPSGAESDTDDQ